MEEFIDWAHYYVTMVFCAVIMTAALANHYKTHITGCVIHIYKLTWDTYNKGVCYRINKINQLSKQFSQTQGEERDRVCDDMRRYRKIYCLNRKEFR